MKNAIGSWAELIWTLPLTAMLVCMVAGADTVLLEDDFGSSGTPIDTLKWQSHTAPAYPDVTWRDNAGDGEPVLDGRNGTRKLMHSQELFTGSVAEPIVRGEFTLEAFFGNELPANYNTFGFVPSGSIWPGSSHSAVCWRLAPVAHSDSGQGMRVWPYWTLSPDGGPSWGFEHAGIETVVFASPDQATPGTRLRIDWNPDENLAAWFIDGELVQATTTDVMGAGTPFTMSEFTFDAQSGAYFIDDVLVVGDDADNPPGSIVLLADDFGRTAHPINTNIWALTGSPSKNWTDANDTKIVVTGGSRSDISSHDVFLPSSTSVMVAEFELDAFWGLAEFYGETSVIGFVRNGELFGPEAEQDATGWRLMVQGDVLHAAPYITSPMSDGEYTGTAIAVQAGDVLAVEWDPGVSGTFSINGVPMEVVVDGTEYGALPWTVNVPTAASEFATYMQTTTRIQLDNIVVMTADAGCTNCDDVRTQVFEELCIAAATNPPTSFQALLAQVSAIAAGILAETNVCTLPPGGDDCQAFIEAEFAAPQ